MKTCCSAQPDAGEVRRSVGNDILLTKLQALVTGSANVSEAEIHEQFSSRTRRLSSTTPC